MQLQISALSQIPIYEQIKSQIKGQILSGKIVAGTQLPSIRMLAKELKIGVITSKRAYDDLCQDGMLVSRVGKGFFVADVDKNYIKNVHKQMIKEKLDEIIKFAQSVQISQCEINDIIIEILGEENDDERN